jgi:hypothetical protein
MTTLATSAPPPKFVMHRGTLAHELGKQEDQSMQETQIGGTGAATLAARKQVP